MNSIDFFEKQVDKAQIELDLLHELDSIISLDLGTTALMNYMTTLIKQKMFTIEALNQLTVEV